MNVLAPFSAKLFLVVNLAVFIGLLLGSYEIGGISALALLLSCFFIGMNLQRYLSRYFWGKFG